MNGNMAPDNLFTDKAAKAFLLLAMSYLFLSLLFGTLSGLQYILPQFLKSQLSFQKTRPLHVYLAITWIFTACQAGFYYYLPRISGRKIFWPKGIWLHFAMQLSVSLFIIISFFNNQFGGREYLEFPPLLGLFIFLSWIPFAINFWATLQPDYRKAPVYVWFWSTGILFFFITLSESYLWLLDFFSTNVIRDITVQWKAIGSMVGSWNMLVYGTGMYLMEKISGDTKINNTRLSFFLYFLGLVNLMFNWGHHTYIVPAEPWIRTVAYIISMTELFILGHIILQWRKKLITARKNYHIISWRLLSFADAWIFLNLALAIAISVPALNFYTHGTHITVAHAMGTTIGINTLILFASVFFLLQSDNPEAVNQQRKTTATGIWMTNIALLIFWVSLLGSGMVKIAGKSRNELFSKIIEDCQPYFRIFSISGFFIFLGACLLMYAAVKIISIKKYPADSAFK